jgi:membrane protein
MAVGEDRGLDGQVPEMADAQAGVSLTPNPAQPAGAKRHTFQAQEQWLLEEERRLLAMESRAVERVKATAAGTYWSRLNAVDFMNSSMQFAVLAVLALFPFVFLVSAESGGDARHALIARLGLNQKAAHDVNVLMSSGNHAVTDLSIAGAALVLLGAIGIASTLQVWYQRVYDQAPAPNWARQLANRLLWLGGLLVYLTVQDFSWTQLKQFGGAWITGYIATFILALAFYWWTPHVLLMGRITWRRLFPAALATAACVTGLGVFSALLFSAQIVSGQADYGPIGVVTVLLSYLIGLGVCLHLGAVAGRLWNERDSKPPADPEELPAAVDR